MLTHKLLHKSFAANVKYLSTQSLKYPAACQNTSSTELKSWKMIPGPSCLPVLGQIHHFLPGGMFYKTEGVELWNRLRNTYGHVVRIEVMLQPTLLALFDPDHIAEVFRGENWYPYRPQVSSLAYFRSQQLSKDGSHQHIGVALENGETWKDIRMKVNQTMVVPKIVKLYENVIDEVAVDMVERVKLFRDDKNMVRENFNKEVNRWSLEATGVVVLGRRLNCFDPNVNESSPAMALAQTIGEMFKISLEMDYKPSIWKYITTPTFNKAMKIYANLEQLTAYFVDQALEDVKAGRSRHGNEKSVIEKLIKVDEHLAHITACDMLIAGVDTMTNTVLSALYLLAKHPEKQRKIREEVASKGNGTYVKACLKESMRLMPTVLQNSRITTKEYNIAGYKIPKNMEILFCHASLSSMDRYYPRAKEFIPERWLVNRDHPLHYKKAHPFVHQPFGFGVRSCIGRRFAELMIETLIARLVESFEIEWVGPAPTYICGLFQYMNAPYNFIISDVKKI